MKFNVGYPIKPHPELTERILERRDSISEVYFAFGSIPSGRGKQTAGDLLEMPWEANSRQIEDLKLFSDAGISLDLLLNGNSTETFPKSAA